MSTSSSNNGEEQAAAADEAASGAPQRGLSRAGKNWGAYGRLSSTGMNFGIPTTQDAHDHALDRHGAHSWRYKTVKFVHSTKIQIVLMSLLFCDVIILFIDLFFAAEYPHCSIIERDAISCCPIEAGTRRMLAETTGGGHAEEELTCPASLQPSFKYPATCNESKWHGIHTAEDVLFAFTLVILGVFWLELNVTMLALTPHVFFRQFFFLLDYVIISVSLALEIFFHAIGDDALYEYVAGILVLGRIWRFVRIGHGIMEITNEMAHRDYSNLLAYTEDLQDRLRQNKIMFPSMDAKLLKATEEQDNILTEVERQHREKLRKEYGSVGQDDNADDGEANKSEAA